MAPADAHAINKERVLALTCNSLPKLELMAEAAELAENRILLLDQPGGSGQEVAFPKGFVVSF